MKNSAPSLLVFTVMTLLVGSGLTATLVSAESQTDQKIRIMAEALKARDAGDLAGAKGKLEALLVFNPNDQQVQRLLQSVNADLSARETAQRQQPAAAGAGESVAIPAAAAAPASSAEAEAEALAAAETRRLQGLISDAQEKLTQARGLTREERHNEALLALDQAAALLPRNAMTKSVLSEIDAERGVVLAKRGAAASAAAPAALKAEVERLIAKGRGQYLAGEVDSAQATFREIESIDPDNSTAKGFLIRIAKEKTAISEMNREKTRAQLIEEVGKAWQRPGIFQERARNVITQAGGAPLMEKLNRIIMPAVNFTNIDLARAVTVLSSASEEFDRTGEGAKGVNIVVLDPAGKNPQVSLSLRNMSLKRVLDFMVEAVGYQYEVQSDAVVVRPGGETSSFETTFFPVTRATVLRMTGQAAQGKTDPTVASENPVGESAMIKSFLQQAGVMFEGQQGASLAYDGAAILVTHTPRNIERIRNILARYNDVRQVEIEAKFMEVQEGALDELGVNWSMSRRGVPQVNPSTGAPVLDASGRQVFVPRETYNTSGVNRQLSQAFTNATTGNAITIANTVGSTTSTSNTPTLPPAIPGAVSLANTASAFANITGFVGEFDVSAVVRALAQKQGSDLLSAPKVTVLSGNQAAITVAQEMRYPQSYGEIQSQVGTGATDGTSSAGVTITAGTPQEFTSRNVGVELKVTPTVEEDDYSISLDLNPKVTEFEGFVEYGGPSLAISGGTSVTVPPGFYQPIFSVREVSTKVTIWDGATLVMGGLTREEVKKVDDKVPVLGDIPLLGRLFRSKGESSQKRNLLIFVTANLMSPGGSPKKQELKSVTPGTIFQNPTIVTPSNAESRVRSDK